MKNLDTQTFEVSPQFMVYGNIARAAEDQVDDWLRNHVEFMLGSSVAAKYVYAAYKGVAEEDINVNTKDVKEQFIKAPELHISNYIMRQVMCS